MTLKHSHRLGIDLGGTKIEAVLLETGGNVLMRRREPTPRESDPATEYKGILKAVHLLIKEARGRLSPGNRRCSIGIGIPGTLNPKTGLVQNANTTSLIGQPFKEDMENLLGQAIGVENDANCFTLAEAAQGAGRAYEMVFGIILGTGCGGGLSVNRRIHRGRHAIAGEWGHISVDPLGTTCYCGNRGCVETKISGGGMARAFEEKYGQPKTLEEIARGYRQGEPRCVRAFEQYLEDFGRCLGGLISILDPDAVVLGGGGSNIDELYTLGREKVRRYVFHEDLQTPILKNKLGDSAGVFGAAWIGV